MHLTRMIAAEAAESGLKVQVNSISTGVFPTEMATDGSYDAQKGHIPREKCVRRCRRLGRGETLTWPRLCCSAPQTST